MINYQIYGIFYFQTHKKLLFHTGTSFFCRCFRHQPDTKGPKESEASVNGRRTRPGHPKATRKNRWFFMDVYWFTPPKYGNNMVIIW